MAIGERIAFYRRRRRLMQRVLANLIGLSEDWLSKIERGERDVRRLDRLADIARKLRVSLSDLLGQPVLMEDDEDRRDDVPRVRDALMAPRRLSRVLYQAAPALENVNTARAAELVEFGWSDYQRGMLGRVVDTLPGLIKAAQQLEDADPASFSADRFMYAAAATALLYDGAQGNQPGGSTGRLYRTSEARLRAWGGERSGEDSALPNACSVFAWND